MSPRLIKKAIINYPAASERGMKRNNTIFTPSPYPSPQGEGTNGNPTASGWGIKNIIKNNPLILVSWCPWPRPGMQCLGYIARTYK